MSKTEYVTRSECHKNIKSLKEDINVIKLALVGPDLRGGLVKDVGVLKGTVDKIKNHRAGISKRNVTLLSVGISGVFLVIVELVKLGIQTLG